MIKTWYERWADYCRKTGKARLIYDRVSQLPYLERFYITSRWMTLWIIRPVIHRFWRSDNECDGLHDHPWPYLTIVLRGGYIEHRLNKPPRIMKPGSFAFARARHLHRVELFKDGKGEEIPTWTLFIMGPRIRKWGFLIDGRWVPWKRWCDFRTSIGKLGLNLTKEQIWRMYDKG